MKYFLIICMVLTLFLLKTEGKPEDLILDNESFTETDNRTVLEKWKQLEIEVKRMANNGIKQLLPFLMENRGKLNISSTCMKQGMFLIGGLKNIKSWAVRFVDSSSKMLDGVLTGSLSSFGEYEECINTVVKSEKAFDRGKILFTGKYCMINVSPPIPPKRNFYKLDEVLEEFKNFSEGGTVISETSKYAQFFHFLTLRMGICVPSGCSVNDIDQVVKQVGTSLFLSTRASRCEVKTENVYTPIKIVVLCAYSFAGLLMLIGSLMDLYTYFTKDTFKSTKARVFLCFSFISNFKKFVNTKTSSDVLSCLNGIRFLCMSWVILGHTYLNINYQMFVGFEKVRAYAKDFAFQAVINASVAVDTFFCIGGLLVCYLTIKLVKIQGHPFNVKLYVIHRLWRILPVYCYVILFLFLGNFLGSGPLWHDSTNKYLTACYNNWWTNLIFINNFYHAEHICLPQSWYIACDFQMYIAAILILIPLIRWPKVGFSICISVIFASILYCGAATYAFEYPPTMLFAHPDPNQRIRYWADFYFRPFVHAGPYTIGILAGYLLAMKPDLQIPRAVQVIGWSLAFISNFSVLYGVFEWNKGVEPTIWGTLFYASLNRSAWTFGVAWMIVCCATGHGGVINYILSFKAFIPLGRLTFIVYLIHPLVQIATVGNIRTRLQPDHFLAVWIFFGHLCITYMTAFAGTMLVESPLMSIEKIIFSKDGGKKKDEELPTRIHVLNGTLKSEKNGDIVAIVPRDSMESLGIDNTAVVYKL